MIHPIEAMDPNGEKDAGLNPFQRKDAGHMMLSSVCCRHALVGAPLPEQRRNYLQIALRPFTGWKANESRSSVLDQNKHCSQPQSMDVGRLVLPKFVQRGRIQASHPANQGRSHRVLKQGLARDHETTLEM